MKKKIIACLSLSALMFTAVAAVKIQPVETYAETPTVYLSSSGNDGNVGSNDLPFATFGKALSAVPDGGIIRIKDSAAVGNWTAHGKTVTVTGGSLDATSLPSLQINDNVTFTDINIVIDASDYICANGYTVVMGAGVSLSNAVDFFAGGDEGTTVAGTSLTLLSGTYKGVFGGSRKGTVDGDTYLTVGGTVNAGLDVSDHTAQRFFLGGGYGDTVTGNTYVTFGENARSIHVFGGSMGSGAIIGGTANLTVTGGESMSVYGGSKGVDTKCDVNATVTGGTFEQIFGGSESAALTGNVHLRVLGGMVTRRIYGGSYNDYGLGWSSSHSVNGDVRLIIGGETNVTFGYNGNDKSIYGHSRYKTNSGTENSQIIFADEAAYLAYKDKLGAQDSTMKLIMNGLSAADDTHYYTYSVDGNAITQGCAYHTLAATATVELDKNSLQYTGAAVTPAHIEYGDGWEYASLTIAYENNVNEGRATYTVSEKIVLFTGNFEIRKAPKILGGSVRLSAPAGLRFQSKVSETLVAEGATFGTLVIPKAVLGENQLTVETSSVRNIPQVKWATESLQKNNPQDYEDGYAYFNAVLTGIPEEHYGKEIVARSYACIDGVYYYSAPVERSIAQVAAYAIKDGYTQTVLYTYVDAALSGETLQMERDVELLESLSYQLNLTGNKGYVAVWESLDESVAKVDGNGRVTAIKPGMVTVTAKIGSRVVSCVVVVKEHWTGTY